MSVLLIVIIGNLLVAPKPSLLLTEFSLHTACCYWLSNHTSWSPSMGKPQPVSQEPWQGCLPRVLLCYPSDRGTFRLLALTIPTGTSPPTPTLGDIWYQLQCIKCCNLCIIRNFFSSLNMQGPRWSLSRPRYDYNSDLILVIRKPKQSRRKLFVPWCLCHTHIPALQSPLSAANFK